MRIFVSGLAMRFRFHETGLVSRIAGPAVYAAVGCALTADTPHLWAAMSTDVDSAELEELRERGIDVSGVERRNRPSLVLETGLVGSAAAYRMSDTPLLWMPSGTDAVTSRDVLLAANGDPEWLRRLLCRTRPAFLAIDLHGSWLRTRVTSMNECVQRADIVAGTEAEFAQLTPDTLEALGASETILLRKNGAGGVTLMKGAARIALPAPAVADVRTDVGAGDLLFGAMAPAIASEIGRSSPRLSTFCDAYTRAMDLVAVLLRSSGPEQFLRDLGHPQRNPHSFGQKSPMSIKATGSCEGSTAPHCSR